MSTEIFLVTGALGCIGAWVLRNLVRREIRTIALDLASDPIRPRLLLSSEELECITFVQADVTDLDQLLALIERRRVTHIIHLAALQVPPCKANPPLGARVNVVGTTNVFEAARRCKGRIQGLAYASSVAVLGPGHLYPQRPVPDDAPLHPETLYGVYKQANEHTARLYWQNWRVSSIGLRPAIVYGVGRDQGLTSDVTKSILAAAAGRPYHIKFDGPVALQYVEDVAHVFVEAARADYTGTIACNLRQDVSNVADFVATLQKETSDARITCEIGHPLPFSANLDDSGLRRILGPIPHKPLVTAVGETLDRFRKLLAQERIGLAQLEP
jgi:nucleoside-diphosphate-sugar epimerase